MSDMLRKRKVSFLAAIVCLAVLVLLAVPVQAAGKGNKWISLRYNFKPGDKLEYAVTTTESGTAVVSAGGNKQEVPSNTKTAMNLTYDVLEVDPQGTATVRLTLDEINIDTQTMGTSVNIKVGATGVKVYSGGMLVFDLGQMGGTEDLPISEMLGLGAMPEGVQLADLFGKGVTVTITRLGEMAIPGTAESSLGALVGFEPDRLTAKLVRPGDIWMSNLPLPGVDEEQIESHGLKAVQIFEGIEDFDGRRCAKIVSKVNVDCSDMYSEEELAAGMNMLKLRGEGITYLDIETGRALKATGEFVQDVQGVQAAGLQALMGGAAAPGATVEVRMSSKALTEMVLKE
jgi:hypothetical protein